MTNDERHNMFLILFLGNLEKPFKKKNQYIRFCDKEKIRLQNLLQEREDHYMHA